LWGDLSQVDIRLVRTADLGQIGPLGKDRDMHPGTAPKVLHPSTWGACQQGGSETTKAVGRFVAGEIAARVCRSPMPVDDSHIGVLL
jgi:hypothetical protein